MINSTYYLLIAIALVTSALCQNGASPQESDYYKITSFTIPEGHSVETGGIALMDDGKIAVCSRRGQIWTIENAADHPNTPAKWTLFAQYLHEPLGLAYLDGWLYAVQRPEVTRMKDLDGDGRADIFETVSDDWGVNGNYHEYTFGSRFDPDGNIWCTLCLTGSFTAESLYRGWVLKINKDGTVKPVACGVRSPGGIGFNALGDAFYTDNQGAWNGSSSLKWIKPNSFQGNPNGNVYFPFSNGAIGERPSDPDYSTESRTDLVRTRIESYIPPAVVLPHGEVGQSPTGVEADLSKGKFGPFAGQTFVAEQTFSQVQRVFLEKINGIYQGAAFHFLSGFKSGNIGLMLTTDGQMFTGGSNRGWGARGPDNNSFERIDWTGKVPFEIHEMRVKHDGFELTFTKPIDVKSATADAFTSEGFTYNYTKKYGSPKVDQIEPVITVTDVSKDGSKLRIKVEPLTKGLVYKLVASGIRSADGKPLLHDSAYYTLNEIPAVE